MALFRYQATDVEGKVRQGRVEAEQERDARAQLRSQGLWVLALSPDQPARGQGLDSTRLTFLVRQWSALLTAGLTVEQSLDALIGQSEDDRERQILAEVRGSVRGGESLSRALGRHPRAFDASLCGLVAAGESAGKLPLLLERMADHLESRQALQQKLGLALLYPMIVALVACGVIAALLSYVVPQVVEVFAGSRQQLPMPTRILIAVSHFLREAGPWLAVLALAVGISAAWLLRERRMRERLHPTLMRLPLIGRLLRQADAGRVASTLGGAGGGRRAPVVRPRHCCPYRPSGASAASRATCGDGRAGRRPSLARPGG
jgi:general secretion pathway protein F